MAATIESAMESSSPISMSFDEKRQAQTNSIPTSVTASVSDGAVTDPEAANEKVSEQKKSSSGVPLKDDGTPLRPGGWRWILILASMYSCMFLLALDNTIVADIQPAIIAEYNDIAKLSWLAGAYLIGTASTNLVWGKVFASFEVKYTYWVTIILFEVGSALCGAAPTMDALIVGRVIAGVGSSGMYVGVMTIAAATTTLAERPTYVALGAVLWGVGTVLGPIVGGAFSISAGGWRWAFYINLFIGAFFLPVYLFMIPKHDPRPNVSQRQRFKELDWIGTLLIVGAFVSFVMALSYGGTVYPWNSGQIIALFVVSGVLFIALGFQQELAWFTSPARRIFPVVFLRSRTMLLLFALSACGGVGILVPLYMIPLFFQFTQGDDALDAGVRILPLILLMITACMVNGAVLSKYGLYMPWYTTGGVLMAVGSGLMYTISSTDSASKVYGFSVLVGIGTGLFCQAGFSVAQAKVALADIPSSVGYIMCGQITGMTISITVANSIFLNEAEKGIAKLLPQLARDEIQNSIRGHGSEFVNSLPAELRAGVMDAVVKGLSNAYILCAVAGTLATILSLGLKRERLFTQ